MQTGAETRLPRGLFDLYELYDPYDRLSNALAGSAHFRSDAPDDYRAWPFAVSYLHAVTYRHAVKPDERFSWQPKPATDEN